MNKQELDQIDSRIVDLENIIDEMHGCCRTFEDHQILRDWQDELKTLKLQEIELKEAEESIVKDYAREI